MIKPRALRPGARVALVAPAGPLAPEAIERAVHRVLALGWEPILGPHTHCHRGYLAGSDADRLLDLREAIGADNDAIWCLRGGYGTMRIVANLDLTPLAEAPRPLIGFSDNTVLHLAARRKGIVTFHGPHAATSDLPAFALDVFLRVLERPEPAGVLPLPETDWAPPQSIVAGTAEGPLIGGNLSLLAAMAGTPYQLTARGAILFLEEVGEPLYRLDRLLTQLLLTGVFDDVAGIVIGAISECPDEAEHGDSPIQVIRDRLGGLRVPVLAGLPFGHIPYNWTLPLGVTARVDADAGRLEILEAAVIA